MAFRAQERFVIGSITLGCCPPPIAPLSPDPSPREPTGPGVALVPELFPIEKGAPGVCTSLDAVSKPRFCASDDRSTQSRRSVGIV